MRAYVLFLRFFILLNASEQFEQDSILTQLLSDRTQPADEYFRLNRNFKENHLLMQLLSKQDSVIRIDNSSVECFQAIEYLVNANLNAKSFQFFDAWGSIPAGILYGHLVDLGNFNECLSARATIEALNQELLGKYVIVKASPARNKTSNGNSLRNKLSLQIGTCFPSICSDETVRNIFQTSMTTIADQKIDIKIPYSKMEADHKSYNAASITAISIFSTLGAVMLLSTVYEYVMLKRETPPNQLLLAFSILTNGRKLFQINTSSNSNNIECLNGLRVISMMWIIYGHSHSVFAAYPLINTLDILSYFKTPFSMLLQASPFAVDSFLLISGVLITWVALPKLEKSNGKLNIPLMYFHRYIRLTPVVAAAILFIVGIWPVLNQGPIWLVNWQILVRSCEKNWWINLLYLTNYFGKDDICLGHSWYLAADMQLFFISPLILMGLWKWKSKFLWILLLIILLSTGCCIATMITNNFNGIIAHGLYDVNQVVKIHEPTHIRIPSWLIGVVLGYRMHCTRNRKQNLSGLQLTFGWIVALLLMITIVFVPYHFSKDLSQATLVEAALFSAFARIAWSIFLSWLIFVCHTGYSRTLNSFLTYAGWQPIARLTFTMYIVSVMLQTNNAAYNRTDVYFSAYNILQFYCGELISTMGWSALVALAVESPIIAMEKYFLTTKKENSKPSA